MTTSITLPSACDFHLHLRQGEMMKMVTPQVASGGVSLAYIMVILIKKNCYCHFIKIPLTEFLFVFPLSLSLHTH
jgi:dihydroorotase